MTTVRIPTQLRTLTGGGRGRRGGRQRGRGAPGPRGRAPRLRRAALRRAGSLRRFVNVFVDEEDVRFLDGLATPVGAGQTLSIVPAVAGG